MTRTLLAALALFIMAIPVVCPALASDSETAAADATAAEAYSPKADDVFSVDSMLVGKQMLQVSDLRQLSLRLDGKVSYTSISPDGRYVVYAVEKQDIVDCRLVKVSTGKTMSLAVYSGLEEPARNVRNEEWHMPGLDDLFGPDEQWPWVVWSPDSRFFALSIQHIVDYKDSPDIRYHVALYTSSGVRKTAVRIPAEDVLNSSMVFSPDSRQLIVSVTPIDPKKSDKTATSQLFSISTSSGAFSTIYSCEAYSLNPLACSDAGAIVCLARLPKSSPLKRISWDCKNEEIVNDNYYRSCVLSPDGTLAPDETRPISFRNVSTDKEVVVTKAPRLHFEAWGPNTKLFLYTQTEDFTDSRCKDRRREMETLWLSTMEASKHGHMCIAIDTEGKPSCSRDCHRIAYISQGQLYIAELSTREPTAKEKLEAGLPLNEEETKEIMLENAKQICAGIRMYMADYHDTYPPADSVLKALGVCADSKVFLRPGGQDQVFNYLNVGGKSEGEIADSTTTVMGELDAGYGWKVVLYCDGHSETKPKQ